MSPTTETTLEPASVTITTEFMEDFHAGRPWAQSQALDQVYVSRDGTAQLLVVTQNPPSVARVFPDPNSMTGWSATKMTLPLDLPNGQSLLKPQAVILTGAQDQLLIYRQFCVQRAALGADGSFSAFSPVPMLQAVPMVQGQLPAGTRYIPEMQILDASGIPRSIVMRTVDTIARTIAIDAPFSAFPVNRPYGQPRVFPLKESNPNAYRCITLADDGELAFVTLALDSTGTKFQLTERSVLPGFRSAFGCVHVHESTPGDVVVVVYGVHALPVDLPALLTVHVTYDPAGVGPCHAELQTAHAPPNLPKQLPAGATVDLVGRYNEPTAEIELYISIISANAADRNFPELWTTTARPYGTWSAAALVDRGCRVAAAFTADLAKFCVFRSATGYEVAAHR
jgi:hypothetical protein